MQLNPVIRGWAQYHQHGSSKQTFAKVDHHIYTMLWQWARRRHPHKSRWWIRDKDFRSEQGNHWVFFGHVTRTDGALTASGEFPLKQSDLGFKPFSIAMGALVVIDEMKIRFDVTARE